MIAALSLQERIDAVVIGASAGGVEALNAILPALPATLRQPIFIVVHLLRDQPSLLPQIFKSKCLLPTCEAQDKEPIERGTVYFSPPDYHMLIDRVSIDKHPQIALSTDELVNFSRPSIDVLFESAADVYGERLLGVILSGANNDGAAGLDAIHRAGGVTAVQEPRTAQVSAMIDAALQSRRADFVLTPEDIAQLLRSLSV